LLLIFYLLILFKVVKFVKRRKMKVKKKIFQKFGIILKEKRKERGLTQEELADRAGIHRTYVAGIEGGHRNPSLKNIYRLAKALKIEIKEFFK